MSIPPLVEPAEGLSGSDRARAARQLLLPGFGDDGQRRLANARVLVIGAGGLGSPVLHYLAGAGVGTIGVVDDDVVDISNLQRQVIHRTADVGELKTASAARAMTAIDPGVVVVQHPMRLTSANALDLFRDYDLVVDGSDNFPTRYLASDAAALLELPYVWGSVLRFDGQVTVFWERASLDYRDLHPVPPAPGDVLSCDEAGVLGTLCGVIGSMMAGEAVKLVTGIGEPLLGRLVSFDALTGSWRESLVRRGPAREKVRGLVDYEAFCGVGSPEATVGDASVRDGSVGDASVGDGSVGVESVGVGALDDTRWTAIVDVRDGWERDIVHLQGDVSIPLVEVLADPASLGPGPVLVYCKTGARSARAVDALRAAGVDAVSLRGGVLAWIEARSPASTRY